MSLDFSARELRDLAAAWAALTVAFAILFGGGVSGLAGDGFVQTLALSAIVVGIGFLAHELAHKFVAQRFGQLAEFRADYGMLLLAIGASFAGFIFAAPGAVYHRGRITRKQNGQIALAGPLTNVVFAVAFLVPLGLAWNAPDSFLYDLGLYGVGINFLLAAFNMLPFGPLDGKTVLRWSKVVFLAAFLPTTGLAILVLATVIL